MSAIPGDIDADQGPPTAIPLGHFVVGLGFLVAGVLEALIGPGGWGWRVGVVHLLLAGWVCVTILGAMTQFVPVWSGVSLHSRRLAVVQLVLVPPGVAGLAASMLLGWLWLAPVAGGVAALGFWLFVYNIGRTLAAVETLDVTERHFAVALVAFALVTTLGPLLALDFTAGVFPVGGISHLAVRRTHATLAVFGAVFATVIGALYQLATMFTQTELGPLERRFQRVETVAYPLGVAALAGGRLLSAAPLARAGGVLVAASVLGVGVVLANRLRLTRVDWTPMLSRYGLVAALAVAWALSALVGWRAAPLASLYGHPGVGAVLLAALVGFTVLGTLYHIVPFLVWVETYSDRLGFESVPLVDDLYDTRLARVELAALVVGGLLVAASTVAPGAERLAGGVSVAAVGGVAVAAGVVLFAGNLALVLVRHGDGLGGDSQASQRTYSE